MITDHRDHEIAHLHGALERALLLNRALLATTVTLDPQAIMQNICDELASVFQVPQVGIALLNPDRAAMTVAANHTENGTSTIGAQIPVVGNPINEYVLAHEVPMYIADVRDDPRLAIIRDLMLRQSIVSMLIIPIWSDGEIIGTVALATYWQRSYSDAEIVVIEQVATAASSALANARLHAAVEQELAHRQAAEAVIRAQADRLMELSTPLLALTETVVLLPLIGQVDAARARQVTSVLLEGVQRRRAQVVLLDITGVSVVDQHVAQMLTGVTQSLRLLGAQVMLTGIRPEVAQLLVGMGVALGCVQTYSTLQQGVSVALLRPHERAVGWRA